MRITCPFCHSEATLHPNPAHDERGSLPRYLFDCSGCVHTIDRRVPGLLLAPSEAPGRREGDTAYTAIRGWLVTNGEFRALTGQDGWEASSRDSEPRRRTTR